MAKCPNCDATVEWSASSCSACTAVFTAHGVWRPVPQSNQESQLIAEKYPTKVPAHGTGRVLYSAFGISIALGTLAWAVAAALGVLDLPCQNRSEKYFPPSEIFRVPLFGLLYLFFLAFGVGLLSILYTAIPVVIAEMWIRKYQTAWVVVFSAIVTIGLNLFQFHALSESCGRIDVSGFIGLVLIAITINGTQSALCFQMANRRIPAESGKPGQIA